MSVHYNRASTPVQSEPQQGQPQAQPQGPQYNYDQNYMLVVDPVSRKLAIPLEAITETLARYRQGIPSLCMLYFSNRCRQNQNCHQVHADPTVVLALRNQAQKSLMCCKTHGDRAHMHQRYQNKYVLQFSGGSGTAIPINRLAMTQGLARYIDEFEQSNGVPHCDNPEKARLTPGTTTICRLHGQDRCRFGQECKFLHLCKELLWTEVSASGMPSQGMRRPAYSPNQHNAPPSPGPYHSEGMPPSPTIMGYGPSSQGRGYYSTAMPMSNESLISMDLSASHAGPTPPMTPTSHLTDSPVIKCKQAGDSWSYEPYGFNPIGGLLPPALDCDM